MKKSKILLADDHSLILQGMRKLIESECEIVGTAENGEALVRLAARTEPDLVLLDVSMPIMNGIDAAREIKKLHPRAKLIFISMHASPVYVRKALEVGASAYILKTGASEELLKAIDCVSRGGTFFRAEGVLKERAAITQPPRSAAKPGTLTSRQRQILQLIGEGKQNKEIAKLLFVSVRTVEFHRGRLMARLGAKTVVDLTRLAIEEGLIAPPAPPLEFAKNS